MNKKAPIRKKFIFRTIIFLGFVFLYIFDLEMLKKIINYDLKYFKVYHVIWLFLMLEMLQVLLPKFNNYISSGKIFARHFRERKAPYDEKAVLHFTKKYNRRAGGAGIFWLTLLLCIGFFYSTGKINVMSIHLIVVFFYFSDEFCINIWCPFGAWIVRSKCCNTCRIHNWNYFMIFSPYIYIFSLWTYSLLITSLIILIQWEYLHFRYPQRFSDVSNINLWCGDCPDKGSTTCKF